MNRARWALLAIVAATAPAACGGGSERGTDAATGGDAAADAAVIELRPLHAELPGWIGMRLRLRRNHGRRRLPRRQRQRRARQRLLGLDAVHQGHRMPDDRPMRAAPA